MGEETRALVLDLVAFVEAAPRPYLETMSAWRTSCPRLTIWEDAVEAGLIERVREPGGGAVVRATARGRAALRQAGRPAASESQMPAGAVAAG